jgi:hypothetical protein
MVVTKQYFSAYLEAIIKFTNVGYRRLVYIADRLVYIAERLVYIAESAMFTSLL